MHCRGCALPQCGAWNRWWWNTLHELTFGRIFCLMLALLVRKLPALIRCQDREFMALCSCEPRAMLDEGTHTIRHEFY